MLFLPLLHTLYHLSLSVQSKFKLKQNGQVVRVFWTLSLQAFEPVPDGKRRLP